MRILRENELKGNILQTRSVGTLHEHISRPFGEHLQICLIWPYCCLTMQCNAHLNSELSQEPLIQTTSHWTLTA